MSDTLIRPLQRRPALATCLTAVLVAQGLSGCGMLSSVLGSSKVDYKVQGQAATPLDVPPDLTQLANDPRYQAPSGGAVSAIALQSAGAPVLLGAPAAVASARDAQVVPKGTPTARVERVGDQRWLVTSLTPEQLWPILREHWQANGMTLIVDKPELGLMETDWYENRGKLPQGALSRALGKVFDSISDSGERDRYRTLVERGANGTEVSITHRGASQMVVGDRTSGEQVRWQNRPSDPSLEAEMLARLLIRLNPPEAVATGKAPATTTVATATQAVTAAAAAPARARLDATRSVPTLQVDDGFDRAWRRVGVALDRNGFTVEDRDRSQGVYFVRYVDPKLAGKEDPNFIARLFGAKKEDLSGKRYQVKVAAEGNTASTVAVLEPEDSSRNAESARNIAQLLLAELR
jgi:outer membrane protein assembly factor BamC